MKERTLYKADKLILILIFGCVIYIPFFVGVIQEDKMVSKVEKRNLNKLPSIPESIQAFIEYPKAFNLYYSDHFGLREFFTKKYFRLMKKFSDKSSVDDVTFGQDGWLFLGSVKPGYHKLNDPMGDAMNINLFSDIDLENFARSLMTIKNWLSNKGIEYVYVIAPNKHTIYFEKLPKYITKLNRESATDQLLRYLQKNTDVMVVDLRKTLLDEKNKHQVYFKTDTHWNHYGANVAQFKIMSKIKPLFPAEKLTPVLLNDNQFNIVTTKGDLAEMAKIENSVEDAPQPVFANTCTPVNEQPKAESTETYTMLCDTQKLNAVIFGDSFFLALQPYFSRRFYRSTYIWEAMNYNSLAKYVEQEQPDIVIDEMIERGFPYIPDSAHFENSPVRD